MKFVIFLASLVVAGSVWGAEGRQSLQAAMVKSPALAALVDAVKASAKVDCLVIDSSLTRKKMGPEGKDAVIQQAACFDPDAFNPTQLGQLVVTYYGLGDAPDAEVGAVTKIEFEVFK